MTTLAELKGPQTKLEPIEGIVTAIKDVKTVNLKSGGQAQVCDVLIRDDTGVINLVLWDAQIKQVKIGSTVRIENGYVTSFKDELKLNVGKYGKLIVVQF